MSKVSRLDAYIDYIKELLGQGYSTYAICGYLYDEYELDICQSSLNGYMARHGLRSKVEMGKRNAPICEECNNYLEFDNVNADRKIRLCNKGKRQINYSVTLSPCWCPKRGANNV